MNPNKSFIVSSRLTRIIDKNESNRQYDSSSLFANIPDNVLEEFGCIEENNETDKGDLENEE